MFRRWPSRGGELKEFRGGADPHHLEIFEWAIHEEPLEGPDKFTERIVEHVLARKSMCILGAARTGRTVTQKAVKAALGASGLQRQAI